MGSIRNVLAITLFQILSLGALRPSRPANGIGLNLAGGAPFAAGRLLSVLPDCDGRFTGDDASNAITARGELLDQVGVFLRCTGEEDPDKALKVVRSLGLGRVQLSRLPDRFYTAEGAKELAGMAKTYSIRVDAVVVVFDGESYKDREAVERTVGFRPARLQEERLAYARKCIDSASALGSKTVTFHAGFLPKDPGDPNYARMLNAVHGLALYASAKAVTVSLETGQETGEELARFLDQITDVRIGVNFDTANLILYGLDSSPRALERLLDRVTSVHVKDGLPPEELGLLGREVRLGEGYAEVGKCLRMLRDHNFHGPLIIENYVWRDRGTNPLDELRIARDFIKKTLAGKH